MHINPVLLHSLLSVPLNARIYEMVAANSETDFFLPKHLIRKKKGTGHI